MARQPSVPTLAALAEVERVVDIDGDVYLWDFGGDGPPIVLLHGLGGARSNWVGVVNGLKKFGRVVVPDLVGFGDTRILGRSVNVDHQAWLAARLIRTLDCGPAVVMGNSMGGMISLLLAGLHPDVVRSVVTVAAAVPLPNPAMRPRTVVHVGLPLIPMLGPRMVERVARGRSAEHSVDMMMSLVMADPSRLGDGQRAVLLDFARRRGGSSHVRAFTDASRSIARQMASPKRFSRMVGALEIPGLIIQGDADAIVRPTSADWIAARQPNWQVEMFEGVGHCPQMEDPATFLRVTSRWLSSTL